VVLELPDEQRAGAPGADDHRPAGLAASSQPVGPDPAYQPVADPGAADRHAQQYPADHIDRDRERPAQEVTDGCPDGRCCRRRKHDLDQFLYAGIFPQAPVQSKNPEYRQLHYRCNDSIALQVFDVLLRYSSIILHEQCDENRQIKEHRVDYDQ